MILLSVFIALLILGCYGSEHQLKGESTASSHLPSLIVTSANGTENTIQDDKRPVRIVSPLSPRQRSLMQPMKLPMNRRQESNKQQDVVNINIQNPLWV